MPVVKAVRSLPREDLPKKNIVNRRVLRKKGLYKLLSKRFLLPKYTSNACTHERLQRLFDPEYSALESSKVICSSHHFTQPLAVLHEAVVRLFEGKYSKKLFHHDVYGNYKYYIYILQHAFPGNYKKLFPDGKIVRREFVEPAARPLTLTRFPNIICKLREHEVTKDALEQELFVMQNTTKVVSDKPPESIRKVINKVWASIAKLSKLNNARRKTLAVIAGTKRKSFVPDPKINSKLLAEIDRITTARLPSSTYDLALTRNVIISREDPSVRFQKKITTDVDVDTGDLRTTFDKEKARVYFDAIIKQDAERFGIYRNMFCEKYGAQPGWESWGPALIEIIPPSIQGFIRFKLLCCWMNPTGVEFWNKVFSIAILPQGNAVLSKMKLDDFFELSGAEIYDTSQFGHFTKMRHQLQMEKDNSIASMCLVRINNTSAMFMRYLIENVNPLPITLRQPFADAVCDTSGNYQLSSVAKLVSDYIFDTYKHRMDVRFFDVDMITMSFLKKQGLPDPKSMAKFHSKSITFERLILSFDLPKYIAQSAASLYPTSSVMKELQTNKVFLHNYLVSAVGSVSLLHESDDTGAMSKIVYNVLRNAEHTPSYLTFMIQMAAVYSDDTIVPHHIASALLEFKVVGVYVVEARMDRVLLVTEGRQIQEACENIINNAKNAQKTPLASNTPKAQPGASVGGRTSFFDKLRNTLFK